MTRWAPSKVLRELCWHLQFMPRRLRTLVLNRVVFRAYAPYPGEVVFVEPTMIRGHLRVSVAQRVRERSGVRHGALVDGDWDREVHYVDFSTTVVFRSCRARWVEGSPWRDTPLYQHYLQQLERGEPSRFRSVQELDDRYRALDAVFEEVRREGNMSTAPEHLVRINFASDGTLIWGPNGQHRIAIARLAGLTLMPASVGFVHLAARHQFRETRLTRSITRPAPVTGR